MVHFLTKIMNTQIELYRYLFPLGIIHAILGTAVWILFQFHGIQFYPGPFHPILMISGFLYSFAFGFFWTAFPRFTQTDLPTKKEASPLVIMLVGQLFLLFHHNVTISYLLTFLSLILTFNFALKRFKNKKSKLPSHFKFIGFALVLGGFSSFLLFLNVFLPIPHVLFLFCKSFYLKGVILFLVIGIGLKLLPMLKGYNYIPFETSRFKKFFNIAPYVLILFFILESIEFSFLAYIILATTTLFIGFEGFHIHKFRFFSHKYRFLLWVSEVTFVFAPFIILIFPQHALHLWHIFFITSFGMMALMVSSRVMISHGGHAVSKEEQKPFIQIIGILIIGAAISRILILNNTTFVFSLYSLSSVLWILALLVWSYNFINYTFKVNHSN